MSTNAWLIRAGKAGHHVKDFAKGYVAIGWGEVGDLRDVDTSAGIKRCLRQFYTLGGGFNAAAAVLHKFRNVLVAGDAVATYDPATRSYLLGEITSEYVFDPTLLAGYPHVRRVNWKRRAFRDVLPRREQYSLGAAFTLFRIPRSTWLAMHEASSAVEDASQIEIDPPVKGFHDKLESEIVHFLQESGLEYVREQPIGGLRPDFVVYGPAGQRVVIEAKAWLPTPGNTDRASAQAQQYLKATNADHAFVVLAGLEADSPERGVVRPQGLVPALRAFLSQKQNQPQRKEANPAADARIVFAAMPFERKYDDTYLIAMSHAAREVGAACERVDHTEFTGDIVEEIERLITVSIAIIADLSDSRPNVLYEAGFARALGKPVVHICSTDLAELPFDVRNWNTIPYVVGSVSALCAPLATRLRAVLGHAS